MSADDYGVIITVVLFVAFVWRTLRALGRQAARQATGNPYQRAYQMEFRRTRLIVLARDGHHCQYPGCHRQGSGMHVHHRHARHDGGSNAPGNLITLCPEHHQLIHGRRF